jgi:hypothetical protein
VCKLFLKLLLVFGQRRRQRDRPLRAGGHVTARAPDFAVIVAATVVAVVVVVATGSGIDGDPKMKPLEINNFKNTDFKKSQSII